MTKTTKRNAARAAYPQDVYDARYARYYESYARCDAQYLPILIKYARRTIAVYDEFAGELDLDVTNLASAHACLAAATQRLAERKATKRTR